MGRRPYSDDLRTRVVAAVAEGCSRRAAAKRFAVSPSSSIRWVGLHEDTGSVSDGGAARAGRRWSRMHRGCWSWLTRSQT